MLKNSITSTKSMEMEELGRSKEKNQILIYKEDDQTKPKDISMSESMILAQSRYFDADGKPCRNNPSKIKSWLDNGDKVVWCLHVRGGTIGW